MRIAILALILAGTSVAAGTEIHRCTLEDGTIAFQETPCPEPVEDTEVSSETGDSPEDSETTAVNDDASGFVNPFDEPAIPPPPPETLLPGPVSEQRAECEKTTRDAIDAVDVEMRENGYTKEQGQQYLAELLELTTQLRDCKQL